jgi:hypothetical protein
MNTAKPSRPTSLKAAWVDLSLPQTAAQGKRDDAMALQYHFNRVSSLPSGKTCGNCPRKGSANDIDVIKTTFKSGKTRASIGNLAYCGSDVCPSCSQGKEVLNLQKTLIAVNKQVAEGMTVAFITMTMQTKFARTPRFYNAEEQMRKSDWYKEHQEELQEMGAKERRARFNELLAEFKENYATQKDSHLDWELNKQFDALSDGQSALFTGAAWLKEKAKFGVKGRVTTRELVPTPKLRSSGERNWDYVRHNLHMHCAIFIEGTPTPIQLQEWEEALNKRWIASMKRSGFHASEKAQDMQYVSGTDIRKIAHYIIKEASTLVRGKHVDPDRPSDAATKWDALLDSKESRVTNDGQFLPVSRSPLNWWRNYEQAQRSRKTVMSSTGFWKIMGVAEEVKAAEEERKKNSTRMIVLSISQGQWQLLRRESPETKWQILNVVENSATAQEIYDVIDQWDIAYKKPVDLDSIPDDASWSDEDDKAFAASQTFEASTLY